MRCIRPARDGEYAQAHKLSSKIVQGRSTYVAPAECVSGRNISVPDFEDVPLPLNAPGKLERCETRVEIELAIAWDVLIHVPERAIIRRI